MPLLYVYNFLRSVVPDNKVQGKKKDFKWIFWKCFFLNEFKKHLKKHFSLIGYASGSGKLNSIMLFNNPEAIWIFFKINPDVQTLGKMQIWLIFFYF